jgi:5-(carboxyamino)imidazole ribonucleotide synthase
MAFEYSHYLCRMQKDPYSVNFKLGVLGGGQLGRMLIQEAINLDIHVACLDPNDKAPCSEIANWFAHGDFNDYDAVMRFGQDKDVLTVEIEHVNIRALKELKRKGVKVYPQPEILEIIKDKGLQKEFYTQNNIPTAPYKLVKSKEELMQNQDLLPVAQKLRTGGYDGKGVTILKSETDLAKAFDAPSVLESFVPFEKELAVIVARNENGEISSFPVVELDFNPEANLVEMLFAPAKITPEIEEKARKVAEDTIEAFGLIGLLAVELFLTKEGDILVNEVAPRPHNSGHHTIEANTTSQYGQHLRSILNLPLGKTDLTQAAAMVNLLGEDGYTGKVRYEGLNECLAMPGVYVHIYGKAETKPFRKMGHVTVTGKNIEEVRELAHKVKATLKVKA